MPGVDVPNGSASGRVALLIDFENLVRGMAGEDSIECELLFRLAEDYGRVLLANAYADWRMKDVNQYQTDLYRLGADLVHVFGKRSAGGFKNAVDVKMAVDAISTVSALPHIDVFVIVSGDRDFIHVLKALRKHGKMIIGVSPSRSSSDDFGALCDRFVKYDSLAAAYDVAPESAATAHIPAGEIDLDAVRHALRTIVDGRPEGIKGAMIKPLLRRELSPAFDESDFGFSRLTALLRALSDTVTVVAGDGSGDVMVYAADAQPAGSVAPTPAPIDTVASKPTVQHWTTLANLRFYRFEQASARRRATLRRLHAIMARQQPFRWEEVQQEMLAETVEAEDALTVTALARIRQLIFQSRGFVFEDPGEDLPQKRRLTRLAAQLDTSASFIRVYEANVIHKVAVAAGGVDAIDATSVAEILGLSIIDGEAAAYCRSLLQDCGDVIAVGPPSAGMNRA